MIEYYWLLCIPKCKQLNDPLLELKFVILFWEICE